MPLIGINASCTIADYDADIVYIYLDFGVATSQELTQPSDTVSHIAPFGVLSFKWGGPTLEDKNKLIILSNGNITNDLFPENGFDFNVVMINANGEATTQPINLKINDSQPTAINYIVPSSEIYLTADCYANVFIEIAPTTTTSDITKIKDVLTAAWSAINNSKFYINIRCFYGGKVESYSTDYMGWGENFIVSMNNIISNLDALKSSLYNEEQTHIISNDENAFSEDSKVLLNFIFNSYNDPAPSDWSNAVYIFKKTDNYALDFVDYASPMIQRLKSIVCPTFLIALEGSPAEQGAVVSSGINYIADRMEYQLHEVDVLNGENLFFNIPSVGDLEPGTMQATIPYPTYVRHLEHGLNYFDYGWFDCISSLNESIYNYGAGCNAIGFNTLRPEASTLDFTTVQCEYYDYDGTTLEFTMRWGDEAGEVEDFTPQAYLRPHLEQYTETGSGLSIEGHEVYVPSTELSTWLMQWYNLNASFFNIDNVNVISTGGMVDITGEAIVDCIARVYEGALRLIFPTYPWPSSWIEKPPLELKNNTAIFKVTVRVECSYGVDYQETSYIDVTVNLAVQPYMGLNVNNVQPIALEDFINGFSTITTKPECNNTFVDMSLLNRTWILNDNKYSRYIGSKSHAPNVNNNIPEMSTAITSVLPVQLLTVYSKGAINSIEMYYAEPNLITQVSVFDPDAE